VEQRAATMAAGLRTQLREAVFDAPDPDPVEIFDHVFSRRTVDLDAQAAQLASERSWPS